MAKKTIFPLQIGHVDVREKKMYWGTSYLFRLDRRATRTGRAVQTRVRCTSDIIQPPWAQVRAEMMRMTSSWLAWAMAPLATGLSLIPRDGEPPPWTMHACLMNNAPRSSLPRPHHHVLDHTAHRMYNIDVVISWLFSEFIWIWSIVKFIKLQYSLHRPKL